jgi:peptide/nickel transport system substrate-binding protein
VAARLSRPLRFLLLAAAATAPVAATAHAEARAAYGGRAVGSLGSAPAALDPLLAQSWAEVGLAGLLYDGLYRLDAAGRVIPQLAEGPPLFAPDGLVARIAVRQGVRFHDGRRLRGADAAASLRRAQGAAFWALAPVKSVAAEGDQVVLSLRRPVPAAELAALLAVPQLAVTPGGRAPAARTLAGTGPFRIVKAEAGRAVELEAWEAHFAGRPYLDAATLRWFDGAEAEARAYEAGATDFSLHGAVVFAGNQPKYATEALDGPATTLVFLGLGTGGGPHAELLGDVDFRRGISLSLSRAVLARIGGGERVVPAVLPESPDLGGGAPSAAEAEAHTDLAAAAFRRAAARHGERRGTLELLVDRDRPEDFEVGSRIVAALYAAGLPVALTRVAPADFTRRVAAGQCDLWIGQLLAPTVDPVHEYAAAFAAGGDGWAAARLADGSLTSASAQAAFAARLPVLPLYHRAVRVHHKATLLGLGFDPIGRLGLADAFAVAAAPLPVSAQDQP